MKLKLKDATIVQLTKYPGEEQTTQVLVLSAILTPPIADKLRCREACYTDDGVPRKFDSYPAPAVQITGADVLMGDTSARANLIHKFKISQPKTGVETDTSLELRMRIHFDGRLPICDFVETQNKQPFVLAINARQEDLNFGEETADADEEGEDEPEKNTGCVACDNDIPMGIGGMHLSGARCTANDKEPALSTAREASGGTHQRKRRTNGAEAVQ